MSSQLKLWSLVMLLAGLLPLGRDHAAAAIDTTGVHLQRSVMIRMRDGANLATDLYIPDNLAAHVPVILIRTPYGKNSNRRLAYTYMFARHGYVIAVQDTRGKFESEGAYVVSGGDPEDSYDTISWLAHQTWSTGRVGMYGCSYSGEIQVRQAHLQHPNLAAMIIQGGAGGLGSAGNRYRYFALRNGGAVELIMAAGWFKYAGNKVYLQRPRWMSSEAFSSLADLFNVTPVSEANFDVPESIWKSLPTRDIMQKASPLPTDWVDLTTRELTDPWWKQFGYLSDDHRVSAPTLHVDSWYDYGPGDVLFMREFFERHATNADARDYQYALISPATHCQTEMVQNPTIIGDRDVGNAAVDAYDVYLRWFDAWLKGEREKLQGMPRIQYFVMGDGGGWAGDPQWPPHDARAVDFYLTSDGRANTRFGTGRLSRTPAEGAAQDTLIYDPAAPVPSLGGPLCCTARSDRLAGAFDQRSIEARNDVLVYSTEPLEKRTVVAGPIHVRLYVSSSAKDTDFTAKLVDVYPDGTAYNIQEGIIRARFREGFDKPSWMQPGNAYPVDIDLEATANSFGAGHRIRLQVSSSNFPRFDRNLNTGGRNFDETTWVIATNEIRHSPAEPSRLTLFLSGESN